MTPKTENRPFDAFCAPRVDLHQVLKTPGAVVSVIALDCSGSMTGLERAAEKATNDHRDGLRAAKDGRHYHLCLTTFANRPRMVCQLAPVSTFRQYSGYQASGGTYLYGTVFWLLHHLVATIESVGNEIAADVRLVVTVISDGNDTASRKYQDRAKRAAAALQGLVGDCQLVSIGLGINGVELARRIGFPDDHRAISLGHTERDLEIASHTMTEASTHFRPCANSLLRGTSRRTG